MEITKIPTRILFAVRQRIGAEDEHDTTHDSKITEMSPKELIAKWSGWTLGTDSWGIDIINMYEELKSFNEVLVCNCGGLVKLTSCYDQLRGMDYETNICTKCGERNHTKFEIVHPGDIT